MPSNKLHQLEFYEGPLDGHYDFFGVPLEPVLVVKTESLPTHSFSELMRKAGGNDALEAFVVAIYELQLRDEQLRYYYASSCIATEHRLSNRKIWFLLLDGQCVPKR